MQKLHNNQSGATHVAVIILVVIIAVVGFVGWKVWNTRHSKSNNNNTSVTDTKTNSDIPSDTTKDTEKTIDTTARSNSDDETKTFNFVNTTGWVKRTSKDGVMSINAGSTQTYGYCKNVSSSILLVMVYMDQSGLYDCGNLKGAVSWQKTANNSTMLLTRIAFGPSEDLWGRGNAKAIEVKLSNGDKANRYEYTNTIDGKSYNTIEYVTTHNSKSYTALMHWESACNLSSGSDISIDYFDTVVQKTWAINN